MSADVVVVDYGVGNLLSVTRALLHVGANPIQTSNPADLASAERLVLPGVGAFGDGMNGLAQAGLIDAVRRFAETERPFLGICLGMQMMLQTSDEFGSNEGLGLVPGKVVAIPPVGTDGRPHKIPHIGWNSLSPVENDWAGTILDGIPVGSAAYFVHSFMATPVDPAHRLADCDYDGHPIAAVIRKGALNGCQFHPEKSGPVGLRILENFLKQ
ncbi:MAG: imidazole glycerol phosphate synthase subunit HisH [Rhodospirillaceae bacterium]|nr:imidazole glycerol phosphate synthase subunit HisH [Rhodospirillales bacterium]